MKHNDKIRILFGAECFAGGTMRHVEYLVRGLDPEKFEVHLIVSGFSLDEHSDKTAGDLEAHGATVKRWPIPHRIAPVRDLRLVRELCRYIKEHKIQVVHAHSSKAGLLFRIAARWCRIPVIYTPHCFYFHACRGAVRQVSVLMETALASITDRIVVSSPEEDSARGILGRHCCRLSVIDNCVDPRDFPDTDRAKVRGNGKPEDDLVFGWIGRFCEQKNWILFLRAAQRLAARSNGYRFIMAGDGPQKKLAEHYLDKHRMKFVKIEGFLKNPARFYDRIDFFVSTSLWEGLPYTYLEAVHHRIPIIIPRTFGMERALSGRGIHYYPTNDTDELVRTMLEVTHHRKETLDTPAVVAQGDSFARFIERHQQIYQETVRTKRECTESNRSYIRT